MKECLKKHMFIRRYSKVSNKIANRTTSSKNTLNFFKTFQVFCKLIVSFDLINLIFFKLVVCYGIFRHLCRPMNRICCCERYPRIKGF